MGLTADQIINLGYWPFIIFGSPKMRDEAFKRYEAVLRRDREEAAGNWFIQP